MDYIHPPSSAFYTTNLIQFRLLARPNKPRSVPSGVISHNKGHCLQGIDSKSWRSIEDKNKRQTVAGLIKLLCAVCAVRIDYHKWKMNASSCIDRRRRMQSLWIKGH